MKLLEERERLEVEEEERRRKEEEENKFDIDKLLANSKKPRVGFPAKRPILSKPTTDVKKGHRNSLPGAAQQPGIAGVKGGSKALDRRSTFSFAPKQTSKKQPQELISPKNAQLPRMGNSKPIPTASGGSFSAQLSNLASKVPKK